VPVFILAALTPHSNASRTYPCQADYTWETIKAASSSAKILLRDQQLMAGNNPNHLNQTIKPIVDRILKTSQLSRQEYLQLVTTFLSDYKVTDDERSQINRIFDDLQTGRLEIVD
jgi:uncharacterized protein YpuA (DUF1002 family)